MKLCKNFKIIFVGISALMLSACATNTNWEQDNCNPNGAYARGMNDGLWSGVANSTPSAGCPAGTDFSLVDSAYKQGFNAGVKYTGE